MFGLIFLDDGDFDFFPIMDDLDWDCATTVFFSSFFVDGNHTGRTPDADVVAAFAAFLAA